MTLYSTIWCDQSPGFPDDVVVLNRHALGIRETFRRIRKLRSGDAVLLNGALGAKHYLIDLWFGVYLTWFRRGVALLISDATWHPRTVPSESRARSLFAAYSWLQKRLLLLCESPRTHYCFLSRDEVASFVRESNVDGSRVHFTRFSSQLPLEILGELHTIARSPPDERLVFAGGNSLRDYVTLIAAATTVDARFIIASSNRHVFDPAKIEFRYLAHHEFFRVMASSAVVAVPLIPTRLRSVGQQTYLNAMALGKLVIVSDVSGVRDHAVPDEHLLVVPPEDPAAMAAALTWALAPENAERVARIAHDGKALAEQMTFAHYCADLGVLLKQVASRLSGTKST